MLTTRTKTKLGAKTAKQAATKPWFRRLLRASLGVGWMVAKPLAKRRARRRVARARQTARALTTTVAAYGPYLGRVVDALEAQPRRRSGPRVGAGAVLGTGALLGAAAMYLLEPKVGREHRRSLRRLVG